MERSVTSPVSAPRLTAGRETSAVARVAARDHPLEETVSTAANLAIGLVSAPTRPVEEAWVVAPTVVVAPMAVAAPMEVDPTEAAAPTEAALTEVVVPTEVAVPTEAARVVAVETVTGAENLATLPEIARRTKS